MSHDPAVLKQIIRSGTIEEFAEVVEPNFCVTPLPTSIDVTILRALLEKFSDFIDRFYPDGIQDQNPVDPGSALSVQRTTLVDLFVSFFGTFIHIDTFQQLDSLRKEDPKILEQLGDFVCLRALRIATHQGDIANLAYGLYNVAAARDPADIENDDDEEDSSDEHTKLPLQYAISPSAVNAEALIDALERCTDDMSLNCMASVIVIATYLPRHDHEDSPFSGPRAASVLIDAHRRAMALNGNSAQAIGTCINNISWITKRAQESFANTNTTQYVANILPSVTSADVARYLYDVIGNICYLRHGRDLCRADQTLLNALVKSKKTHTTSPKAAKCYEFAIGLILHTESKSEEEELKKIVETSSPALASIVEDPQPYNFLIWENWETSSQRLGAKKICENFAALMGDIKQELTRSPECWVAYSPRHFVDGLEAFGKVISEILQNRCLFSTTGAEKGLEQLKWILNFLKGENPKKKK
jgi:hypothetical protein